MSAIFFRCQYVPLYCVNSLILGGFEWNFRKVIFSCEIGPTERLSLDLTGDNSTLVQVWPGVVMQQVITWANVYPIQFFHMASLGHNNFKESTVHGC